MSKTKTQTAFIFILVRLICSTTPQAFNGGLLPHLQTGFTIAQIKNLQITAATTFTVQLTRGAFDPSEEVHIGTALQDFTYYSLNSQTASNKYYVHIQVVNPRMTPNLKAFQYNIKTTNVQANVLNRGYRIKRVRLGYILVGSHFGGYYSPTLPSSYIFARNSEMFAPSIPDSSMSATMVDFKTPTFESPFLYSPDPIKYPGCGAVKKNGHWVIEIENCTEIKATLFITGFDMMAPAEISVYSGVLLGDSIMSLQVDLKSPGATFSADSNKDGIQVIASTQFVNFYQVSMVMIALREYSDGTYPLQGTFVDHFSANAYINLMPLPIGPGKIVPMIPEAADLFRVSFPVYPTLNYDPWQFGHRFCGLMGVAQQITANFEATDPKTEQYVGFIVVDSEINPDLVLGQLRVDHYPVPDGTVNLLDLNEGQFGATMNCFLITAKAPCSETMIPVQIVNPKVTVTPATAATVTFSGIGNYAASTDPNKLPSSTVLSTQSIASTATTTIIAYRIQVPTTTIKVGAYEGVLYVYTPDASLVASVQATLTLNVFGTSIVSETSDVLNEKYWHFGFHNNNANTNTNNNNNFNTITITYTIHANNNNIDAAINNQVVEFALFEHSQVLSINHTCSNACSSYNNYHTGIDYTASPPQCIICDASLNLVFSPVAGRCVCDAGYYMKAGLCTVCTVNLCGTCNALATSCTQCVANAHFISVSAPALGCLCNAGSYRSGAQCLFCSPGCLACTTASECMICVANNNTRQGPALRCVCLAGFYETGTGVCSKCAAECLTCAITATNCLTCNTTGNFNLTGTTCQCQHGYYVASINNQPQCLKCHFSCSNCSGDAAACLSCRSPEWTKQGSQCICNKAMKYVYFNNMAVDGFCVDQTCSSIDLQCVQCSLILTTAKYICRKCNEIGNFVLAGDGSNSCVCKSGFLMVNGSCVACGTGCQTCDPTTKCISCALGGYANGTASCSCSPGTYLTDAYDGLLQCMPCNQNCAQCQISASICTRCQNGFSTANNTCVCPLGKYPTSDNANCLNCMIGCLQCTNISTCTGCSKGYILSVGTCLLNCPVSTFNGGDQCIQCGQNCKMCNIAIDCRVCHTGYLMYLGSCRVACPVGTYPYSNSLCIACSPSCATCIGNPNTCLSCTGSLILNGNQCTTACPTGSYFDGQSCGKCASPCLSCSESADKCTSCPAGQYVHNNQCVIQCPTPSPTSPINGICTSACPEGSYPSVSASGAYCPKCNTNCKTCSSASASACTSCNNNLLLHQGTCIARCPGSTILYGGACLECDANCLGCSGSPSSCINCRPGAYRLVNRCYTQCPPGYYPDHTTLMCKRCDAGCKTCLGPGQCSACIEDGIIPNDGQCPPNIKCGANCLVCVDDACTQCATNLFWNGLACHNYCPPGATVKNGVCICQTGTFLSLGSCVSQCNLGYISISNQCVACMSPCKTCTQSITGCTSCMNGYTLDQVNSKCIQIPVSCPLGQYSSNFADCRYICQEGAYYLDSACYVGRCPAGYTIDSSRRICAKKSIVVSTGCSAPLFLQDMACVRACDAGFYPNDVTRICAACSPNCLACSGPNTCMTCAPGTTLSSYTNTNINTYTNVCTISADPCPTAWLHYNDICVSTCPTGTIASDGYCTRMCGSSLYYYDSVCYPQCPNNMLQTADACVTVCPFGHIRDGNACVPTIKTNCAQGQYFDTTVRSCKTCKSPCSTCLGLPTFCTSCISMHSLRSAGICVSDASCPAGSYLSNTNANTGVGTGGCQKCPTKCQTCSNANTCSTCDVGFTNTGADCIKTTSALNSVMLQQVTAVKSGSIVYIQLQCSIIPNNLPTNLASQILLFVPSIANPTIQVNIWVTNNNNNDNNNSNNIFVALTHAGPSIPSYMANFMMNANVFDSIYRSMGYTIANVAISIPISNNLPQAPSYTNNNNFNINNSNNNKNFNIPAHSMAARAFSLKNLAAFNNIHLNSLAYKSIVANQKVS